MSSAEQSSSAEQVLLEAYSQRGESPAELFSHVYQELRQVARAYMRRERADHTLQATELVNEAYLRLFEGQPFRWENRKHLFCTVARAMRRVLVDHARSHGAERHGGAFRKVTLDDQSPAIYQDLPQFLALNQALERLAELNARQAQVVELHSFAGLTEEEIAEVLDVSLKTVKNDWRFAKAWLRTEMGGPDDSGTPRADAGESSRRRLIFPQSRARPISMRSAAPTWICGSAFGACLQPTAPSRSACRSASLRPRSSPVRNAAVSMTIHFWIVRAITSGLPLHYPALCSLTVSTNWNR